MFLAEPWWVNLFLLVPILVFFAWRENGLAVTAETLVVLTLFTASFGFVEAAMVV